ncbi:MAG: hypothetical protein BJ554DRAFT_2004 [Olpidium bornovanus]|uniref:Uncharacterized protein n=1 Tax=Olpidium bornovanus TaxID=278681 RepID=A0A8H7ZRJ6_9FUNG|nr:MAG: hypothetical protein BJ554DRAFT_2004 [Olpidium bornovanus]
MLECCRLLLLAVAALAAIGGAVGSEEAAVSVSIRFSPDAPGPPILVAKRSVGFERAAELPERADRRALQKRRAVDGAGRSRLERRQESAPTFIGEPRLDVLLGKRDEKPAASSRLEKRQESGPTLIGEPRLHVLLGKRDVEPAASSRLEKRQESTPALIGEPRLHVLLGKRDEEPAASSRLEKRQELTPTLIGEPRLHVLLGKRDEKPAAFSRLEKRQESTPTLIGEPRLHVLLGKRDEEPAASSRLEKRQESTPTLIGEPRMHVLLGKRDGSGPRLRKRNSAAKSPKKAPATASAQNEGGILSPIQFRPYALELSMPFSVAGLALTFTVFFLMLRGSAAIDDRARAAMQKSAIQMDWKA